MNLTSITPEAGTRHADVIAGCAAFGAFLAVHPELPLGWNPLHYPVFGPTDEAERAEVDRIAKILGVIPEESPDGTHYSATRHFGGGITYEARAIAKRRMDEHYAVMSYRGSVQPEADAA